MSRAIFKDKTCSSIMPSGLLSAFKNPEVMQIRIEERRSPFTEGEQPMLWEGVRKKRELTEGEKGGFPQTLQWPLTNYCSVQEALNFWNFQTLSHHI